MIFQTTSNNTESPGKKRTVSDVKGRLIKSAPSGLEMDWKGREFGISACVNAFSAKSKCKLAICPDCVVRRDDNLNTESKTIKSKRRRTSRTGSGGNAAKSTGKKKVGNCSRRTAADINDLALLTDIKFLARRRKESENGYANIATTCYDCGVSF